MAFKRQFLPHSEGFDKKYLLANFAGIGMNFAADRAQDPNIEDVVLEASIEGMENDDLRVLSILTTWLALHHAVLNVDRLARIIASHQSTRVKAYWAAIGMRFKSQRFAKIINIYSGPAINLLRVGADFLIKRHGEDQRFIDSPLRVAANTLRDRTSDVLTPAQLASIHNPYRWRMIIGPSYRADMWAQLERNTQLSTAELARLAYGSFATAWKVKRDWAILHVELPR